MLQYFDTMQDESGNALAGGTLTVTQYPGGGAASIYATNGTASPIAGGVVTADVTGQVSFFAPDGAYILAYAYNATVYKTRSNVQFTDPMSFVAASDTGTANNYVVTNSAYPVNKYVGLKLEFLAAHANTGASTMNYQADGGTNITQPGGSALAPNMIAANGLTRLEWDGTEWQLIGAQSQPYYPITNAETAAGVTIVTFTYPEMTLERYGGGVGFSAAANDTALSACFLVSTQKGGGILNTPAFNAPNGTYSFAASHSIPKGTIIQGSGQGTEWLYTGASSFLTIASSSGRIKISDLLIYGTSQGGTGLTLGDSSGNGTRVELHRIVMNSWNIALLIIGGTWDSFYDCEFGSALGGTHSSPVLSNNTGIAFNPINSGNYSSAINFYNCTVSNNGTAGVSSTNTSLITANQFGWYACNVQNNNVAATSGSQFFQGLCVGFTISGMYMEYTLGGTAPNSLNLDGSGTGSVSDSFINTSNNGIIDVGGGGCSEIDIFRVEILSSTTTDINFSTDTDIVARDITHSGTITVTGTGSVYLPSGSGLAPLSGMNLAYGTNPAIAFGTSGSIAQTVAAATYSQTKNPNGGSTVTFSFRINWTTTSSPSGTVTITNALPVASKSGGPDVGFAVGYSVAITVASGYLSAVIGNGSTTANLYNVQTTTAAVAGAAFAANGTLIISGSYQTA